MYYRRKEAPVMDADNFKDFAKEMAEYITNYMENIRDRWAKTTRHIIERMFDEYIKRYSLYTRRVIRFNFVNFGARTSFINFQTSVAYGGAGLHETPFTVRSAAEPRRMEGYYGRHREGDNARCK